MQMTVLHSPDDVLADLKAEIASLRLDYASLKDEAKAAGTKQYDATRDQLSSVLSSIKTRLSGDVSDTRKSIPAELETLRSFLGTVGDGAEKVVSRHAISVAVGAIAVGFLMGRLSR